jgi:hypothetical protein
LQYPKNTKTIKLKAEKVIPEVDRFIDTVELYSTGVVCCHEYFKVSTNKTLAGILKTSDKTQSFLIKNSTFFEVLLKNALKVYKKTPANRKKP